MAKTPKVTEIAALEDLPDPPEAGQVADYEVDDLTGAPIGQAEDSAVAVYEPESASESLSIGAYSSAPDIGTDDVELLRLRLLQGLSTEVQEGTGHPGEWAVTGHDPTVAATVIPMMYAKRREYRSTDEDRNLLCKSDNGVVGEGTPGGLCGSCKLAQWTKNEAKGKNDPPLCTPIHSYLGYSLTHNEIVQLNLSRTSAAAAKMLNFAILSRKMGNFAVKLTSQANKTNRGSYFTPVISVTAVSKNDLSLAKAAFSLE